MNPRLNILISVVYLFLIGSMGFVAPDLKANASHRANWTTHEWGIEPKDVLHFRFQISLVDQDYLQIAGYRTSLSVLLQIESIPQYSGIPQYFEDIFQSYPEGFIKSYLKLISLLYLSPSVNVSIIELRLDNTPYSERNFASSLITDYIDFFNYGYLILPIDILDYATTLFINGKTERLTDEGAIAEFKVKYSAIYFRVEQRFKWTYENDGTSTVLEFSRRDGILNEYESIEIRYFDEEDAEHYGITPGAHSIKIRIERLQGQMVGYPHSQTPGFVFLLAILSFCFYGISRKRRNSTVKHHEYRYQ